MDGDMKQLLQAIMAQTASQSAQTEALQQRLEQQTEALQQPLEQQQTMHQETMSKLIDSMKTVPGTSEKSAPKFDHFDKTKEKWEQYLQRFQQHLDIYGISAAERKRACLLSWVGPETYSLLRNLFGATDVTTQTFDALSAKLSEHFKDTIHVQAARYAFYNCKMQPGQTYADWVACLRGLSKDCGFECTSDACGHKSYVDELIRDQIINETPHADVRRQCLLETDPSL